MWAEPARGRVAAPGHEVAHGDALRRDRLLREHAEARGHRSGGKAVDVGAVEHHAAGAGLQEPGQAAQQCRLAAGVGADDDRHLPWRDRDRQVVDDDTGVVAEAQVLRAEGRRVVARWGHPPRPIVLARASRYSRYGAPKMPVMTPTGSWVGEKISRATTSDAMSRSAPQAAAGSSARVRPPTRRRAICGETRATKVIGDRTSGGSGKSGSGRVDLGGGRIINKK